MRSYLHVRLLLTGGLVGALAWAVVVSFLCTGPAVAQSGGWSEPINISNTPGNSRYPEIAADAWGNVHVVWSEDEDGQGWGESIYYTMWNGEAWTESVDIFYTPPAAHIPAVAADSLGYVHVVWNANNTTRYSRARIGDGPWSAAAWSRPQILSTQSAFTTYWTDIAVDDQGNLHVVWTERSAEDELEDLYYSRSVDGGQSWSLPINLSSTPEQQSSFEQIITDAEGNPHVVWLELSRSRAGWDEGDVGVFHSWSSDGGESWFAPEEMSQPGPEGFSGAYPAIIADDQYVYTIWNERRNDPRRDTIFARRWEDGWWSDIAVVTDDSGMIGTSGIWTRVRGVADGAGNLHLVWETWDGEAITVQYVWSEDGGQTWSVPVAISNPSPPSELWRTDIAVSEENRLHVVWFGGGDIYYATYQTTARAETPLPYVASTSAPPTATTPATMPSPTAVIGSTPNPAMVQGGVLQSSWFPLLAGIVPVIALVLLVIAVRGRARQ